ncbi:gliding motility-associated C-terminal domain-containing protein [uncultured Pontibacter sp.]|uniref:T9SS type B sorting domain-containing protein n=1 Tax=uncultured Pontibacter sp. TaxID=453356 RepID=UPI0026187769|nr:gliding motility-associated C-terminal domain-containing protein [uncultured Pontibacter sp.]
MDLSSNPNGLWDSRNDNQNVTRRGQLCGADKQENCIQFRVTLHPNAGGLELEIVAGPEPSGSMIYRLNNGNDECGGRTANVGDPICVDGPGPHTITLCMPGNAGHEFVIKSIAAFEPQDDIKVTGGCIGILKAPIAFEESSIVWRDITGGGLYNKYLSFPNGNSEAVVTPDEFAPAFVDYEVCGNSVASPCSSLPYCDVVRVYFYPKPVASIGPEPAIICPGGSGVELTGTVTGGDGDFDYFWYGPNNTVVGNNITYTANTIGTYKFVVVPRNSINCQEFSATTNVVTNLSANAGQDQLACASGTVQLAGTVTAALGGRWSTGGSGTFSNPDNLNAVYTPSAADISAGSVRLTLTSTGNGNCSPVSDQVLITFYNMAVTLDGTPVICNGTLGTITANVTGAQGTVSYLWSNGATTASINGLSAGSYTVTVTDEKGCALSQSLTITEVTGPSNFTATTSNATCGASNGSITVTGVTEGTAPYTYSKDGTNFQTSATISGLAPGSHTITVKDANGCTVAKAFTLTNIPGPTAVAVSSSPASCNNNDGSITAGAVTGGTSPYQYSINGTTFQTSTAFTGLASGSYTLTARDANGCTVTAAVTVSLATLTNFTATPASSTCGASNGSVTVSDIVGGISPYTYSKDGSAFQASATLTGLAAGTHTITVKDAKGCTFAKQVTVTNIAGPTNFTTSLKATTCGAANGEITVTGRTGGTSPYTYSKDGVNFQTSATFTGLAAGSHTITVKDANGCIVAKSFTLTNIAGPTAAAATAGAASCADNDGSITAGAVTGGTSPYQYSINGTTFQTSTAFTGLASGSYTLTARDANGCTVTTAVTIEKVMPTGFTATPTAATCGNSNGTVVVSNIIGGTSPYTYSKNGTTFQTSATLTGFAEGTHTITIKDARGCTFAKTVTITNIPGPTDLQATVQASTCGNPNGSFTVSTVTGGTWNYTYSINGGAFQSSNSFSALAAGDYQVTVKDANGCLYTETVVVSNIAGPEFTAAATASTCGNSNGRINVAVSGGTSPFKYSKDGTNFQDAALFDNLAAGTYSITVRDANGCLKTASVAVTNIAGPTNMNLASTASTCGASNGIVRVNGTTGGVSPYTYSINGGAFQSGTSFSNLLAGNYTITVKDANNCTFSKSITVTNTAGPTDLIATVKASTCGAANGEFTVSNVTGGTATYTYSIDGTNFQASATFTALIARTYNVTVRDANGCTHTEAVVVSDVAGPSNFTAAVTTTSCGRNNGSIRVTAVTGGTSAYTYSKDGTSFQSSNTFGSLTAGTYTITVKDANGCIFAKDVVVEDVAGPSNFVLTANASTCGASNGTIAVGAVTGGTSPYTYSKDGTNFQTSTSFGSLAEGSYTITVKDANGCTIAKQIAVTNIAGPSDFAATASNTTCGAANGEIRVTGVTGGASGYTYSKDGVNFQASATFTGLAASSHTITVKDANGCITSKSFTLTNIAGPTAVSATSAAASCADNDGSITAGAVTGGTAPYQYSINGTTFQSSTAFTGLASGSYTLTAKDANGCTVTRTVSVTKNIPTNFASTTKASTCGSNNGTITVGTVTGGFSPYTYSKDGSTFQTSATLTGFVAGTHTITVKDAKGCIIARQVTVSDVAGPSDLTASATSSTCGNPNGQLTVTNVSGGVEPYTYSINGAAFQTSATFTGLAEGTHNISVRDANGCTFAKDVAVSNIAGPNFTATAQASTCGASNGRISVSEVNGGTTPYTYSINGGTFQSSTSFTGLAAGTYTIAVKDANGCTATREVEVTDIAGPSGLTLASNASTCGSANGSISVSNVAGGTAPYTYSLNDGTFQTSASFGTVLAGTYTITVKDANGCTFSKEIEVENIAGPTDFTATAKATTCGTSNGEITVTGVTGGTAGYTYSKDGVNFQTETTLTGFAAGTHTITVRDANGCTFEKSVTVTNIGGPTAVAASATPASCNDNDGSITAGTVTGGTAPYTYSINGTTFQSATAFNGLASGSYTLTAKDANGCTVTRTVTVGENVPTNFASSTVPSTCGRSDGSITVGTVTGGTAPYTYSVNNGSFQSGATFSELAAGAHRITVRDAKGCEFTKSVTLENVEGPQFSASTTATTCGANNGRITVGTVTGGVAPYTYSIDGTNFQSTTQFTNVLAGEYSVSVKDANGCIGTVTVEVQDIAGPSDFTMAGAASTCGNSNATISISDVVGGTAPYAYSKDGSTFQTSANFGSLAAGEYTITVKDANGCLIAKTIEVADIPGPSELTLASTASTCGSANGVVTVNGVTGGTAPYTYAINGTTFQAGTRFESVLAGTYTVTVKDANGCTFSREITVTDIAGPSDLVATAKASTCGASNGELTITGTTGGTAPYQYSKDGVNFQSETTLTGFAAGTHTITVKDANGCTFEKGFTVTDIAGPTAVAATSGAASCADNDGLITAGTVTGGTAPYQYSINGTTFQTSTAFTGLASGSYTLTVRDANGCTVTRAVTINKNIPTNFATTTTASTCGSNNGTITVGEVTGGFAPYTYSKDGTTFQASATLNGFVAGTHTITVKDAKGCTYAAQVQVSDIAGPSELAIAPKASTCGDPNASFSINGVTGGTAPYTYSIDGTNFQSATSFASLAAGDYQVTVKDANGCTYTQEVTLENIPGPSDFVVTAQSSSCGRANGTVTVASVEEGTAPYTYSTDGTNFQTSATLTGLLAGEHTITVKDANGCVISKAVTIEDVAGPSEMTLTSAASTCGSANGTITVTGVTGGTAGYTYSIDGNSFQSGTAFEAVLAGTYTVTVKDANGCTFSKEIVVTDIAGPSDLTASTKASTCGAANAELTLTNVSGGTAPFSYSIDGTNFQAAATFTGLLAGSHSITVKDANGCTFAKAFTVTDIAGPAAVAASAQAATCADNDGRITAGTVTGGTAPYTYSLNGGAFQSRTAFTALASGEYTLTVRDANGCETTTTVKVDKEGPGSFVASTSNSTCGSDNGSIRVTSVNGGVAPYTYSLNGGAYQSAANFSGLLAGEYTVTVKDANDCTHTETITISDVAGPSDLTASAQNTTCGNSNGQISVSNVTGGTAPYTYSINGTNFQSSASLTALAAGEYLVTVKDANGCTFAKAVTVTNTDGPEGFATTTKASTCGASNGSVSIGAVTGGRAPYTYSKDGSNFQNSAELTGMAAGNHTVFIKDANGCTFSKAVVIENIAGPTEFALTASTATCGEANGGIEVSGVKGGTAPYTYSLNGGDFQSNAGFVSIAAGEHTITVKDANGCTIDKKVVVDNVAGPSDLTASTTAASCDANDGTITVGQVTGGTAPYTYSLNGGAFQASTAFAALAPGEYEVTVKDANGCSTVTTVTVGQKGPKEATVVAQQAACGETNGSITVTAVNGGTTPYTYSLNGGSFQASATFANLAAGAYTITIKDAEGCAITVEQSVSNSGGVESFTATGTDASCGERNGRIAISAIVGGTAPYTYSIDGTNFVSDASFTGLAEGEYTVYVKDASGCMLTETVTLQNSPMLTDVKFTVSAATCGDAAGEVVVTEVTGGTAPYAYSLDGTNFSSSATLANVAAGSYTLTVKDAKGCTFSVALTVDGRNSEIAYVRNISCFGETNGAIGFTVTGGDANTEYSIDNGKTFQKNPEFTGLAKGTYQLVTRFSADCRIELGKVEVKEPALLQMAVTPSNGVMGQPNSGSAAVTTISGGTAPYSYSLNYGEYAADSVFKNLRGGEHFLIVRDANGCTTELTFTVESLGELDIPNGFTPNGDGINDRWVIRNLPELYPNCRVTVFNRWGSPVFESKGYGKEWDGTHNGKRLPDGTYYAIIEFGDAIPAVKTSVTIMR